MRKSAGAAAAAWLNTTYLPVIEQNPLPASGFTACCFSELCWAFYS